MKHIYKIFIVLAVLVTVGAGCAVDKKEILLEGRTDNSGFKLISSGGELVTQLRDDVNIVDFQGADLINGGTATFVTSSATAIATTTKLGIGDGTTSTPSLYFNDDTNLGFSRPTDDIITLEASSFWLAFDDINYADFNIDSSGDLTISTASGSTTTITYDLVAPNLYSGIHQVTEDGGTVDVFDQAITTDATADSWHGYSFLVDGSDVLNIFGRENDGDVASTTVQINTSTLEYVTFGVVNKSPTVTTTVQEGSEISPTCEIKGDIDRGGLTYCIYLDGGQTCSQNPCNINN